MVNLLQAEGGVTGLRIEITDVSITKDAVIDAVKRALQRNPRLNYADQVFDVVDPETDNEVVLLFSESFGYQAGSAQKTYSEFEYYLDGYLKGYFEGDQRLVVRHLSGYNLMRLEENETMLCNLGSGGVGTISIDRDNNEEPGEIRATITWNTDAPEVIGQFYYEDERDRILKLGVS